jgi:hypothetical protein
VLFVKEIKVSHLRNKGIADDIAELMMAFDHEHKRNARMFNVAVIIWFGTRFELQSPATKANNAFASGHKRLEIPS